MIRLPVYGSEDLVLLMHRLLALDQSSRITGWSIFDGNGNLLDFGHFSVDDNDVGVRLEKIRNYVARLISDYNIDYLIMEDIQYQTNVAGNVQTFKVLAEVFGVIYELATELDIPNSSVLAVQWKSVLSIKGKARAEQKKNAQTYVINTYNIKPTQDEADSICIGTYYFKNQKTEDYNWDL